MADFFKAHAFASLSKLLLVEEHERWQRGEKGLGVLQPRDRLILVQPPLLHVELVHQITPSHTRQTPWDPTKQKNVSRRTQGQQKRSFPEGDVQ